MTHFLWCDLETTGLDPESRHIIEAAFVLTKGPDTLFEEIGDVEGFVTMPGQAAWDRYALEMHQQSGLIEEYDASDPYRLRDLEGLARDLLLGTFKPRLAARNPEFDGGFLKAHMPTLFDELHYRRFDVTALCTVDDTLRDAVDTDAIEGEAHRAMFDIRRDLELAREFVRRYRGENNEFQARPKAGTHEMPRDK